MKRRMIGGPAITLVMLFLLALTVRGGDGEDEMWDEEKARFTFGELHVQIEAAEDEAIRLVSSGREIEKRPQGAFYAIKYLGLIRSVEAVPVLCDQLLYEQQVVKYREIVGDKFIYPCVGALARIGLPAVEGLLKKISNSETSTKYRQVAMDVIAIEIVGVRDVTGTVERYEASAEITKKEVQRERLNLFKKEFRARYRYKEILGAENENTPPKQNNKGKKSELAKGNASESNGSDSTPSVEREEKPRPIEEPQPEIEAIEEQTQQSREWLIICLTTAVFVLAGLVIFLLLRRKK